MSEIEAEPATRRITLTVNGEARSLDVEPRKLLADVIRQDLGLTGLNIGCAHGVCGSCTILVDGASVRACIMLGVQADGAEITTIEGVAPSFDEMHIVQDAFWEKQGLQCGYCTPGMVLRSVELLRENPNPTREDVREGIASNLCRCTGYQFIVDAVMHAAERMRSGETAAPSDETEAVPTDAADLTPGGDSNPAPASHP